MKNHNFLFVNCIFARLVSWEYKSGILLLMKKSQVFLWVVKVSRVVKRFFFFKHSFDERSRYRSRVIAHTTRILNRARNNYSSIFFFFFFFFFFSLQRASDRGSMKLFIPKRIHILN